MSEMTPKEFAVWKQRQEEKILRLRVESEEIRCATEKLRLKACERAEKDRIAAEDLRLKAYERAEKDRLAEEEFRNESDERVP